MLKFEESERPSFVELGKLVLTSTENTIETPNNKSASNTNLAAKKTTKGMKSAEEHKVQAPPKAPSGENTPLGEEISDSVKKLHKVDLSHSINPATVTG